MNFSTDRDRAVEKISSEKTGLTPHELVRRQVENLDYHVTDEDMENMIISVKLTKNERLESDKEADGLENKKAGTSYDVLD